MLSPFPDKLSHRAKWITDGWTNHSIEVALRQKINCFSIRFPIMKAGIILLGMIMRHIVLIILMDNFPHYYILTGCWGNIQGQVISELPTRTEQIEWKGKSEITFFTRDAPHMYVYCKGKDWWKVLFWWIFATSLKFEIYHRNEEISYSKCHFSHSRSRTRIPYLHVLENQPKLHQSPQIFLASKSVVQITECKCN